MKLLLLCSFILNAFGHNFINTGFNELPEEILSAAVCGSFHKQNKSTTDCSSKTCESSDLNFYITDFTVVRNKSLLDTPQLVCKDYNIINLAWKSEYDFAYFLEVSSEEGRAFSNVTLCTDYALEYLSAETLYHIRLWGVSFKEKKIIRSDVLNVTTTNRNFVPSPVQEISLKKLLLKEDVYDAVIQWQPNSDFSCLYVLVCFGESVSEAYVNAIPGAQPFTLGGLAFGANYTVAIMAKSSHYESQKKSFSIVTPSCLETYRSVKKCRPEKPKNLTISEKLTDATSEVLLYDVHLSWAKPELVPDYYVVHFVNINLEKANQTEKFYNISGDRTDAVLGKIELGTFYHVVLSACSSAGCSEKLGEDRHRSAITINVAPNQWSLPMLVSVVVGLLLSVLCIFTLLTCAIKRYRSKKRRKEQRNRYFRELENKIHMENVEIDLIKNDDDHWEIDPNMLHFQSVIGEGAFGIVRRAYLEMKDGSKPDVAVKMLKESPTADEVRQFTHEINIMKSVRQHPYIASLIGCITKGRIDGPVLVVEYCSRGDLQSYLRNAWDKFSNISTCIDYEPTSSNYFANKAYDFHSLNVDDEFVIQPKHLLSIARQVALGMEHLANTRVVHRDLAARNVLVCNDHTVKVSDFGLSRDVYQDNVYCKTGGGKLPVRWMALESLTHQRYTTQSDVWSFGVLLWEIVTLGSTPYPGIHSSDLLQFLKTGNRLSCPAACSPDLYAIMHDCWKASPSSRPTFTELCKSLDGLLENVSHYLKLENVEQADKFTRNSNECYVKPVSAPSTRP